MKFRRPFAGLLIAALVFAPAAFSWGASAQATPGPSDQVRGVPGALFCDDHTEITARLGKIYGEVRVGFGRLDDGRLVEIFTSPLGTWSLLVTVAGGSTCLVASGEGWQIPPADKIGFAI